LRKGISELIGGAFEWLFCPVGKEGKNLNKPIFKSSNPGGGGGRGGGGGIPVGKGGGGRWFFFGVKKGGRGIPRGVWGEGGGKFKRAKLEV